MGTLDLESIKIDKNIGETSIDIDVWYRSEVEFPFEVKDNMGFRADVYESCEANKLILKTHLSTSDKSIWVGLYRKQRKQFSDYDPVISKVCRFYRSQFNEAIEKAKAQHLQALPRVKELKPENIIQKNFLEEILKEEQVSV